MSPSSQRSRRSVNWGWLLIMLAAITWGTTGTTSKWLASTANASPLLVGFVRMAVAAPLLLPAARLAEGRLRPQGPAFLGAGLCMAAYQLCFFSAVPRAGVAATALLVICTAPLMIAVLASLFLDERLGGRTLLALLMGVTGTGLLVGGSGTHAGHDLLSGGLLALGAGLSYALYAVVTKAGLGGTRPLSLAAATFSVAALALLPILVFQWPSTHTFTAGWPLFLYLGVVPTALAYGLYTHGLHRTSATLAGIGSLLEPLTATVLGLIVFHETLGTLGAVGAALLLSALLLLSLAPQPLGSAIPDGPTSRIG